MCNTQTHTHNTSFADTFQVPWTNSIVMIIELVWIKSEHSLWFMVTTWQYEYMLVLEVFFLLNWVIKLILVNWFLEIVRLKIDYRQTMKSNSIIFKKTKPNKYRNKWKLYEYDTFGIISLKNDTIHQFGSKYIFNYNRSKYVKITQDVPPFLWNGSIVTEMKQL